MVLTEVKSMVFKKLLGNSIVYFIIIVRHVG